MSWRHLLRSLALATCCCVVVACSESETPEEEGELADSVVVEIGTKGGTVKAKGVSLSIPEGALSKDTKISISKVDSDKVSLPKDVGAVSEVYEFGPKGTKFNKPVEVQIDTEKDDPSAKVFFTKENDEAQFEQLASVSTDKKVSAQTKHFSLGFAGVPAGGMPSGDAGMDASEPIDQGDGDGEPQLDASVSDDDASAGELDAASESDATDNGHIDAGELAGDIITVTSLTPWGEPGDQTWIAYQDGDEPWQLVTVHPTTGTYKFGITNGRYGLAYVCAGSGSQGNVHYATTNRTEHTIAQTVACSGAGPTPRSLSGTVTSALSEGSFNWAHRLGLGGMPYTGPSMAYTVGSLPEGLVTDIAIAMKNSSNVVTRMFVVRDKETTGDVSNFDIDADTIGFLPDSATATVLNVPTATLATFSTEFTTNRSGFGLDLGGSSNPDGESVFKDFAQVPQNQMREDDRYRIYASDGNIFAQRSVELFTKDGGGLTVTMPDAFSAGISVDQTDYFAASMTFEEVPNATEYSLQVSHSSVILTVTAELDWFTNAGTSHTLTIPDLSDAPGFQSSYAPATNAMGVVGTGAAIERRETATNELRTFSSTSVTLPPMPQ